MIKEVQDSQGQIVLFIDGAGARGLGVGLGGRPCWAARWQALTPALSSILSPLVAEIHNIVGAGKSDGAMDASNLLKPMLA